MEAVIEAAVWCAVAAYGEFGYVVGFLNVVCPVEVEGQTGVILQS